MCFTIGLEDKSSKNNETAFVTKKLEESEIFFSIYCTKNKTFIKTFLENDENKKTSCDILSQYIFDVYIKNYIYKYINLYYSYFDKNEKNEIYESFATDREKRFVSAKLFEYLKENNSLLVEGFVNFRLKDYLLDAEDRIEIIVEDMLAKKEYYEFIKLLKYFINVRDSKCDTVNIVKSKNGAYVLYDNQGNKIEADGRKEFMFEISDEEFCINDVLINDLISISPKRVIIHNKENFENVQILKTVEGIFENHFEYCPGCDLCKNK